MIRPFSGTDLHVLRRMICETIDVSYSGVYPPRAVGFFKEYHAVEKIAERSAAGEILVLVSEQDGAVLATGALVDSEIVGVFVRPDQQRHGYGTAVMAELERKARAKGLSEVSLSVSLPSRTFYEHLGYDVLDECAIDVGEGEFLKFWPGKKVLRP
jgi:GNAT superfamily N-acetyltransferase